MRRREFITLLGGAAVTASSAAWPLAARAQQPAMPVVGFLSGTEANTFAPHVAGFRQGLKEAGYVEGQNMAVEYRWADNQLERLPVLAADLVRRPVSVLFAVGGLPTALAAKAATPTIPIVLAFGSDPVKLGLVASLNRPGGNVTGVTFLAAQLGSKRLDLLRDLVPQPTTVGFLSDPQNPTAEEQTRDILAAGQALGRQVIVLDARSDRDFEPAFANFIEFRADALVVGSTPLFTSDRKKLVALAARHKIPAIYESREFAVDGGLMSYGASVVDAVRLGGVYVGQILKGAKPADLPVQQSTRFELVINLKTAKALDLDIPDKLLALADEVIE
jgi:putative tryptophan/tyrosine transport system substrate-binding protein